MRIVKLIVVLVVGLAVGAGLVIGYYRLTAEKAADVAKMISLSFAAGADGASLLQTGWSLPPERWGAWSVGPRAEVSLPVVDPLQGTVNFKLLLDIFVGSRNPQRQTVFVELNGRRILSIDVQDGVTEKPFVISVPTSDLLKDKPNKLVFLIGYPVSPAEIGQGTETRKLGVGLRQIDISYVPAVVYAD